MANAPKDRGLDGRAREISGRIDHRHPTTKIKHLRERYGDSFASGWNGDRTLGELLKETKFESLTQYLMERGQKHLMERVQKLPPRGFAEALGRSFTISFDSGLSSDQIAGVLRAMADYYRACGGIGLELELEATGAESQEHISV